MQGGFADVGFLAQGDVGGPGGAVGGHVAQHDQAIAVLLGVDGGIEGLVGKDNLGGEVGGDRVGLGDDLEVAALEHQEVGKDEVGVDIGGELEAGAGQDLNGVERRGGIDVVDDS